MEQGRDICGSRSTEQLKNSSPSGVKIHGEASTLNRSTFALRTRSQTRARREPPLKMAERLSPAPSGIPPLEAAEGASHASRQVPRHAGAQSLFLKLVLRVLTFPRDRTRRGPVLPLACRRSDVPAEHWGQRSAQAEKHPPTSGGEPSRRGTMPRKRKSISSRRAGLR